MQNLNLLALLGLLLLVSCGSDAPTMFPPVNEYLVVGNDKGFRDDFINQANHITVFDSFVRVRSLRAVDSEREYPIVNGYVEGDSDPALHWRFDSVGHDTLMLTDTARNSTFYLHRLNRLDSLPQVVPLLTSGEVHLGHGNSFTGWESMLFKNFGQAAGCFVRRGYYPYRDWTKMTGVSKVDSLPAPEYYIRRTPPASLWRVYERFAQPILVMDNRDRGMSVILLDSVAAQRDTLYGRVITDRSFNRIGAFEIMVADTAVSTVDNSFLSGIEGKPVATKLAPDKVRSQARRFPSGLKTVLCGPCRAMFPTKRTWGNSPNACLRSAPKPLVSRSVCGYILTRQRIN